jgi:uncharacterized protein (TIGR02284 family)
MGIKVEPKGAMNILSTQEQRLVAVLHDLFTSCASTLRSAGEMIEDLPLRRRILENEKVWQESADQLGELITNGPEPARIGTGVVASLRQTWMRVKAAVGDTRAIVSECDRRESEARRNLETILMDELAPEVRQTLERITKATGQLPSLT